MKRIATVLMLAALVLAGCARGSVTPTPTAQEVITKAALKAFASQDIDTILGLLADDVVFRQEPPGIRIEGKAQVESAFRRITEWKQQMSATSPLKVDGDTVAFSATITGDDLRIIGMDSMDADFEVRIRNSKIDLWISKPMSKDWERATELMAGGVGVKVDATEQGLIVREFAPASPAREAGVKVGDMIVAVDGVAYSQMRKAGEWQYRIRGPIGSKSRWTVIRAGTTTPVDIEVTLADYERLWK